MALTLDPLDLIDLLADLKDLANLMDLLADLKDLLDDNTGPFSAVNVVLLLLPSSKLGCPLGPGVPWSPRVPRGLGVPRGFGVPRGLGVPSSLLSAVT